MPIEFITGRMGAGKTALVTERARALNAQGARVLFVVPEQATLLTEWALMNGLERDGFFDDIEVLSPSRLMHRVLESAEGAAHTWIDERGRRAALRAAALEAEGSLRAYAGAAARDGFIDRLRGTLGELARAQIPTEALAEAAEQTEGALGDKLRDLARIMTCYRTLLADAYVDSEDALPLFERTAAVAPLLRGAHVFVDGFDVMPAQLAAMLPSVAAAAAGLTVTFRLPGGGERDLAVFAPVKRACERLHEALGTRGLTPVYTALPPPEARNAITHLTRELFAYPYMTYGGATHEVTVRVCPDPAREAAFAADEALHCLRGGLNINEVALACTDLNLYGAALKRALELRGVPAFADLARPALAHPMCAYLLSALGCAMRHYPQRDFLRVVKSGYAGLDDDEADLLAASVISADASGWRLEQPFMEGDEGEPLRAAVMARLVPLEKAVRGAAAGRDITRAIWTFVEASGIPERVQEENDPYARQVLDILISLLEQLDGLLGGGNVGGRLPPNHPLGPLAPDPISDAAHPGTGEGINDPSPPAPAGVMGDSKGPMALWQGPGGSAPSVTHGLLEHIVQALKEGLSEGVSVIPPTQDELLITSIEHLRAQGLKRLILVGANDGLLPAAAAEGLFNEDERAALTSRVGFFGEDAAGALCLERVTLLAALSLPSEGLYISYALKGGDGAALRPSPYIKRITRVLPELAPISALGGHPLDGVSHPAATLEAVAAGLRHWADGGPQPDGLLDAASWLMRDPRSRDAMRNIRLTLTKRAERMDVTGEAARALYGAQRTSISRIETFARCPYDHFVQYGLRPRRIRKPRIDPLDEGNFQHKAAEELLRALPLNNLRGITREEIDRLAAEAANAALREIKPGATRGGRAQARIRELGRIARRTARAVTYQLAAGEFAPVDVEVAFGKDNPITLEVPGVGPVRVEGRIDRVDMWRSGDERYVRVIDYKTSQRPFDLCEAYFGLKLQLFIYLDAAARVLDAAPAGMFLFHIADKPLKTDENDPETLAALAARNMKLDGLVIARHEVVSAMDAGMERSSGVINGVTLNKDGSFAKNSSAIVEPEELTALIRFARALAARLIGRALGGEVTAAPVKRSNRLACAYCEQSALCPYDPLLKPDTARDADMSRKKALERMIND